MKKSLFGAASIAALLIAGSAYASDSSTVTQPGNNNNANVDQTAASGTTTSTVTQTSDDNGATVTQSGSNNTSTVTQDTDGNTSGNAADVTQTGATGTVTIGQKGSSFGGVQQGGIGETAYIYQLGSNPGSFELSRQHLHHPERNGRNRLGLPKR